jgi:hypothetical protein
MHHFTKVRLDELLKDFNPIFDFIKWAVKAAVIRIYKHIQYNGSY